MLLEQTIRGLWQWKLLSLKSSSQEFWVRNATTSDLNLPDLGIRIVAGRTVDIFKLRPGLSLDRFNKSKESGLLYKCLKAKKLVELHKAPLDTSLLSNAIYTISNQPIPSRAKSSIKLDTSDSDFVEDMEEENIRLDGLSATRYVKYTEGIVDPILSSLEDDGMQQENNNTVDK